MKGTDGKTIRIRWYSIHILFAGLIAALLISAFAQASDALSGSWLRNPDLSDDAEQKIETAAQAMFDKATRGGRNIPLDDIAQIQKRLQFVIATFVQFADMLDIEEAGGELHIDDGEGRVRIFYVDGKKHQRQTPDGAKLETICRRDGHRIVVEQKLERGGKIQETYVPTSEGDRMELTVRFESKQFKHPLIVRNVYDRQD